MLLTIDSRKRVPLGRLLTDESVSLLDASVVNGTIVLKPMHAVPADESWLHKNPEALASVRQGIKDAGDGKLQTYRPAKKKSAGE
jgi:hypothetical protein